MAIYRVTTRWQGFQGAPGWSNFHFTDIAVGQSAENARDRVVAFFNEVNDILPTDVQFTTLGEVAVLDEATGMITGYENATDDAGIGSGEAPGAYSAASGAVITWTTGGVRNGRRVRGRTFIVPLAGSAYESDGTLSPSTIQTLQAGAQELVGTGFDSGFAIWARPTNGADGGVYEVTGYRVPDMAAVLRSRRD